MAGSNRSGDWKSCKSVLVKVYKDIIYILLALIKIKKKIKSALKETCTCCMLLVKPEQRQAVANGIVRAVHLLPWTGMHTIYRVSHITSA